MTERLKKMFEDFEKSPIQIGEEVYIKKGLYETYGDLEKTVLGKITNIIGDEYQITFNEYGRGKDTQLMIKITDICSRYNAYNVGHNPFNEKGGKIRTLNYTFDSIISELELQEKRRVDDYIFDGVKCHEVNWNPFVYDKNGEKMYYQRGFCWTLKDKQNLIESIYNRINLGLVLIRKRSWEEIVKMRKNGETELAFKDIIDGKQRLNTIREFLHDEFPDSYGYYYSELSKFSQNKFSDNQNIQYAVMDENTKDEDVLYQFLKLNFAGVPQSTEHIEYVKSLLNKV